MKYLNLKVLVPNQLTNEAWIHTDRGKGAYALPVIGDESLMNRND